MSGIGRYIRSILTELIKENRNCEYMLAGDQNEIFRFLQELSYLNLRAAKTIKYNYDIYSLGEQIFGSKLIKDYGSADAFFFPHFNAPYVIPKNSVVTIHDLIHFKFPEYFGRFKVLVAKKVLSNAVYKAGGIIVISESTKNDLLHMFPNYSLESKLMVIPQGVSKQFRPESNELISYFKKKNNLGRYLLYIGNRKPHKNLTRLVKAYSLLLKEKPDLQLVVCGQRFKELDEVDSLKYNLKLPNLIELSNINDAELLCLYSGAEAFVFPSLYEGFGLPPLEAMACGTPVVVSNTSSLPEVVGDAGIYVNPYNVEDIANGIYKVLTDRNLQNDLSNKGLERAKHFTWENTAKDTFKVLEEVANNTRG